MLNTLRNLFVTIFGVLLGYFAPLKDIVFVIFFVFLLNCLFGLLAGVGRPLDGLGLLRLQRLDGGDGVFDGGSLGQAELPQ